MKNLKVELLNTDRIWYYGHPEVRNYGSPSISLDDNDGKLKYFDESKSIKENMKENKIYRIYDCGSVEMIYK